MCHSQNCKIPGHTVCRSRFEVMHSHSWCKIPGRSIHKHEMLILLTIPGHTYKRTPNKSTITMQNNGRSGGRFVRRSELVTLDNLRCSQPSSQPSSSTAQPWRLQTYSSKQRRLQVTWRSKGTVEDTALFTSSTFAKQCYHIIQFMRSPEIDRCFPDYLNNKHAR